MKNDVWVVERRKALRKSLKKLKQHSFLNSDEINEVENELKELSKE